MHFFSVVHSILSFVCSFNHSASAVGLYTCSLPSIVDVEKDIDSAFRKIVEKKYGRGEQVIEVVLNAVMKDWVEKQVVE